MKVLWIGKTPSGTGAGDELFDRRMVDACTRLGHDVTVFCPKRVPRSREIFNLMTGSPHYRSWYESRENHQAVRQHAKGKDLTICSCEPFDAIASCMTTPVIPILHNITSRACKTVFPTSTIAAGVAWYTAAWERNVYRSPHFIAIATLSTLDAAYVKSIAPAATVIWTPPGMPPEAPLSDDAVAKPELILSGTYDWFPKRRDVMAFANEYSSLPKRFPIFADGLPPDARALLSAQPPPDAKSNASTIRFGLITDRFEAGHKLKSTYYLANNSVVLSFADIIHDFADIPDADFFIRKIRHAQDIEKHVAEVLAADPADLRARLANFKTACAGRFSWNTSAALLLASAQKLVSPPSDAKMVPSIA
jgi:hypothetical protein